MKNYISIDLFAGAGGMSEGLKLARFKTKFAFEIDPIASMTYKMNHTKTRVFIQDIRTVKTQKVINALRGQRVHLLAACPPCQGFSSIRRLNRNKPIDDERNYLIKDFVRFINDLRPYTIMLENVPGLRLSEEFHTALVSLQSFGYFIDYDIINVRDYGVPQNRKRLILVGSLLGPITIAPPTHEVATVRTAIAGLPLPENSTDSVHKVFPHHIERIKQLICQIPKNGGSLKDLSEEWQLKCHKANNVGFNDVYGRLRWDACATTITGGCLNPSKGRFLHPEQNRCISAREASMLQTFPPNYKFPTKIAKTKIALMIGNALPPKFCKIQADHIRSHLDYYLKNEKPHK